MFDRAIRAGGTAGVALALMLFAPARAGAQGGTARSMDIDPSVIATGMGGASTAVTWTTEPNVWANPALLGYVRGIHWQWGHTRLVPEISPDITFNTNRFTFGAYGVGLEAAGKPVDGFGGTRLDYGPSSGTDPSGNPIGTFDAYEDVDAMGIGISVERLANSLLALRGARLPAPLRHFDFAAGYAQKHTVVSLAPGADGSGEPRDRGILVRAGAEAGELGLKGVPGLTLEASYGNAVLNYSDVLFTFPGEPPTAPSRIKLEGYAARVGLDPAPTMPLAASGFRRLLIEGMRPLVAVGFAQDREHVSAPSPSLPYDVTHAGFELALLNVVSVRAGHVTNEFDNIDAGTFGVGVSLPVGDIAALRYDFGTYPQSANSGLKDLKRHAISFFLDPIALRRALR